MALTVSSCCCGCTLRTGCIIIAVLGIIGAISQIIVFAVALNQDGASVQNPYTASVIGMIIICAFLVANILLLVGVSTLNRKLFIAWMVTAVLECAMDAIAILIVIIAWSGYTGGVEIAGPVIGTIIGYILRILVLFYFFVVVKSHFDEIQGAECTGRVYA